MRGVNELCGAMRAHTFRGELLYGGFGRAIRELTQKGLPRRIVTAATLVWFVHNNIRNDFKRETKRSKDLLKSN